MKLRIFLCLAVLTTGCATAGSINQNYSKIVWDDGISLGEAELMGKKQLVDSKYLLDYQIINPLVRNDEYSQKYPDFWFIEFTSKQWTDLSSYLVVIHKQNGAIPFEGVYLAGRMPELGWVFEEKIPEPK